MDLPVPHGEESNPIFLFVMTLKVKSIASRWKGRKSL